MVSRSAPYGMDNSSRTIVLIPARLGSTRLPDKPLATIAGVPMIVQVWRRAREAGVGPVVVACAEPEIAEAVRAAGGKAVLTDPALPSGTDRIFAALHERRPERRFQRVVNLQGDLPTLDPGRRSRQVLEPLDALGTDIGTLANADRGRARARRSQRGQGRGQPSTRTAPTLGRALYFTRATAPAGPGPVWHHIGIYAFTRAALERFAALPPSPLERRERLEQLRALEHGMSIGVRLVDAVPFGVDTPADLEKARRLLEAGA